MVTIPPRKDWHIDKGIPVAIIVAVGGQLFFGGWYLSKYDNRITDHDGRIAQLERHEDANRIPMQLIGERLSRIEGKIDMMNDNKRIDNALPR